MLELARLAWTALWERRGRTLGAVVGIAIAFAALMFKGKTVLEINDQN